MKLHPFASFLDTFVPEVEKKSRQLNLSTWILETTGSSDAAELKASLDTDLKFLFQSPSIYRDLLKWNQDKELRDPVLKRQLDILIHSFKQNQISKDLVCQIAEKEAALSQTYANFRPNLDGKALSENDIREILKNENDSSCRKRAWEASKEIGLALSSQILELVRLRNLSAKSLGYSDFFEMQLDLQEVDRAWLSSVLESFAERSNRAYQSMLGKLENSLHQRFGKSELGPWSWGDPFCQEDPIDIYELDRLVEGVDILSTCKSFYAKCGFDVNAIMEKSDMFERSNKNQHAFCINIDRKKDIRTLNNVKSSIKWLETVLHELGHGIYELGFDDQLPWLLREPPHMIPTEAMALLAGRQAYRSRSLPRLVGPKAEHLMKKADDSLTRRQLIFGRWVLVMCAFESELYRNPEQNLNRLWWDLVEKFQMIPAPKGREGKADWAAKYHIGLAPVYYFSYLLGEMFASMIQESLNKECNDQGLDSPDAGRFLKEKLFAPGNRWSWPQLIGHVTGQELSCDAWLREFAK